MCKTADAQTGYFQDYDPGCHGGDRHEQTELLLSFYVIEKNRPFYEKIVSQIEWPRIVRHVKASLQEQMEQLLVDDANTKDPANVREWDFCMDIFATSFGYYMLDYIYRRRKLDDKKIVQDTGYIMMMLEKKECA